MGMWSKKFQDVPTALADDPAEDRGMHTETNYVIVEALMRKDRKVRENAGMTGILKSTVHEIIAYLNFRKVSSSWVPKMLT